jgi:Ala-tRNA(Pro) deacylase
VNTITVPVSKAFIKVKLFFSIRSKRKPYSSCKGGIAMPNLLLVDYLQRSHAQYSLLSTPAAFTAEESALLCRTPPRRFAKVVMARVDSELMMVVMPAHYRLVPQALRHELNAKNVELATERHFQRRFPRCELGAIPPFGHLFGLRALMVNAFEEFGDIFCKAGTHSEILRMSFFEFQRLAHLEPIGKGASIRLRNPMHSHLQRLLKLARQQTASASARAPLLARAGWNN